MLSVHVETFDLKHLVENILNREYWGVKHNVLEYDGFSVTISLYQIDVEDNKFMLIVRVSKGTLSDYNFNSLPIDVNNYTHAVSSIKSTIKRTIRNILRMEAKYSDEYSYATDKDGEITQEREDELEIYLDEQEVEDSDIRMAYINANLETCWDNREMVIENYLESNLEHYERVVDNYIEILGDDDIE